MAMQKSPKTFCRIATCVFTPENAQQRNLDLQRSPRNLDSQRSPKSEGKGVGYRVGRLCLLEERNVRSTGGGCESTVNPRRQGMPHPDRAAERATPQKEQAQPPQHCNLPPEGLCADATVDFPNAANFTGSGVWGIPKRWECRLTGGLVGKGSTAVGGLGCAPVPPSLAGGISPRHRRDVHPQS